MRPQFSQLTISLPALTCDAVAVVTFIWQPVQTPCSIATIAASPLLLKRRSNRPSKSPSTLAASSSRSLASSSCRLSSALDFVSRSLNCREIDSFVARATKESISRQLSDLETKSKALESRQEELAKERDELAAKVDGDLLGRFERLFNSKGDAAIVAIEHGVCTGCHMKVTTATASQVKAGKEIVSCENCGRILYLGE